ncbi:MAG: AAA family ATPase [Bacteroidales bacterium]|nr:AAA family ATPase [Bacteroidales bacterium]
MGRVIATVNTQEGAGKTTTATNLAACLAMLGKKVLLIDADAKAVATSSLNLDIDDPDRPTVHKLMKGLCGIAESIIGTEIDNLKFIASDINLIGAEFEFLDNDGRNLILRKKLFSVKDDFDLTIIDCGSSLGIVTLNALAAADSVLIPVQAEFYALDGIGKLLQTVRLMQESENPGLEIEGFVITMFDGRSKTQSQSVAEIRSIFKDMVFDTVILRNDKINEAPMHGMPVVLFDPSSNSTANYTKLAKEVLSHRR